MSLQPTILSTKKLLPAVKDVLQQHHFNIIDEAFICFKYVINFEKASSINISDEVIVFTSANAVKSYIENVQHFFIVPTCKRVFCLNGQTLIAAKQLLNIKIEGVAEDALSLARLIVNDKDIDRVTFFCGDHRRNELQSYLNKNKVVVNEIILYESILTPVTINYDVDALLFFSPTAVDSYLSINNIAPSTTCFCVGNTTAQYVQLKSTNEVIVAVHPSQGAIAACVLKYYNEKETII